MKLKKAQMKLIVSIAILTLSLVIIIGIWNVFFQKAEASTAESICMGFNALRMKTDVKAGNVPLFTTVPSTCKTLDKVIPSDTYPQTKEGAMEEMRDLTAKCWWMFLEGSEQNMFSKRWPFGDDPCFTCYRFKIKKNIEEFSLQEFDQSLIDTTYLANIDEDLDDCAPIGGGKCISEDKIEGKRCNDKDYPNLKLVVASNKCEKNKKCCINSKSNECENKGGKCLDLAEGETCKNKGGEYTKQYDKWSCRSGACCIEDDNYYSYLDYVQRFRGDGAILYAIQDLKFKPEEEQYAITFISPPECGWGCKTLVGISIGAGVLGGIALGIATSGIAIPILLGGAVATGGTAASLILVGNPKINVIMVSELDPVSNTCSVQPDVTGD